MNLTNVVGVMELEPVMTRDVDLGAGMDLNPGVTPYIAIYN